MLTTTYLGLTLAHPVVPSSSPLSSDVAGVRRLEDAGAAAVVLPSLFEEQIERDARRLDHFLDYGTHSYAEALDFFPEPVDYSVSGDDYLELVAASSAAVDIPVIASLNGATPGGWTRYARLIEQAGAAALELNLYHLATDLNTSSATLERRYLEVVDEVRSNVAIPLAVKVGPYFTAFASVARQLVAAGADGLVLFNRFYQPDFDLEALEVVPHLVLSSSAELRLPLRWVAILHGHIACDLAITGGVHEAEDVLKGLMAGAAITMMASELLARGPGRIRSVVDEVRSWLEEHGYASVEQLQGSMSQRHVTDGEAFERANYMRVLQSWRPDPTGALEG